jgi:predicted XRE-type DNA-binding protein
MTTNEILTLAGLDKSDLSRLRPLNVERFTIDRIISYLDALGFSTSIDVMPKRAS